MPSRIADISATRLRRLASAVALAALAVALTAGSSRGDPASRYSAGKQRANALQAQIQAETNKIQGFEGTISSLQTRLTAVQRSVAIQENLLFQVRAQLLSAQTRLTALKLQFARDQKVLAAQMLSDYESPTPGVVNVIVDAQGFQDLLNQLNDMKAIKRGNTRVVDLVLNQRKAVSAQAHRLALAQARRQRATAAVVVERDDIAQLKLSIVDRELTEAHARAANRGALTSLQKTLSHEASVLDADAARAQAASVVGSAPPPAGGCVNTPFVPHGGEFGLFLAPGTNYTVNEEPVLAARLDALGKALQLHLIGVSGYRSPAHSVEVGGFADDPHTRGVASDTPGVEGVSEATLEQYCLTRPFPGAREADHIQELGSA